MTDPDSERIADALVEQAATLFDVHDNVSRVIGNLHLPLDEFQDRYDILMDDSFDFEAMVRVYLYMQVTGLSQTAVTDQIAVLEHLQIRFGLDGAPTQAALSYTKRKRFSGKLRSLLNSIADDIGEAASDHGIQSQDFRQPDPDPDPTEIQETSTPLHCSVESAEGCGIASL